MATKEQERKALEQIKKIIAELGENSYIAAAMDGMIEDAEENIRNDFAMSWKGRAQTAEQACDLRREEAYKLREELRTVKSELDLAKATIKQQSEQFLAVSDKLKACTAERDDAQQEAVSMQLQNDELMDEVKTMKMDHENEVIRLKAKLYDLMVK